MNATIVVYGSSTGTCEAIAEKIAQKLGCEAINVQDLTTDVVNNNQNLILGTSTWGAGELQDDWYDGLKVLQGANLSGKTIALFGCGDCESYSDTFVGGIGELYNVKPVVHISWELWILTAIPSTTLKLLLMVSSWVCPLTM